MAANFGQFPANFWFSGALLHMNVISKKRLLLSCILYPVSYILYPVSCILYHISVCTLYCAEFIVPNLVCMI